MIIAAETEPGTTAAPKDQTVKWVTQKEHDRLEKFLYKNYVRRTENGKPDPSSKQFYYRVTGMHPSAPAYRGMEQPMGNTESYVLIFEVQKYHRNKFRSVKVREDGGAEHEERQNQPVAKWEMGARGNWIVVDEDANFHMNAYEFEKKFEPDGNS